MHATTSKFNQAFKHSKFNDTANLWRNISFQERRIYANNILICQWYDYDTINDVGKLGKY